MTIIDECKAAGYSHVQTMGGPIPLDDWRPYGKSPVTGAFSVVFFLDGSDIGERLDHPTTRDIENSKGFVFGRWPLVQVVDASPTR